MSQLYHIPGNLYAEVGVLSLTEVALSGLAGQQDLNTGDHQIAWDLVPCGSATFLLRRFCPQNYFIFKTGNL